MRWLIRRQLKSKDAEIRREAVLKLSQKANVDDAPSFAQALQDENASVRSAAGSAIDVLRQTAADPCINLLLPWLKDSDFALRMSGAVALDRLGWRPTTSEERVLNAIALGHFNTISPKEEAAVDILLPLLKTGSNSIRFAVAQTLEQLQLHDPRIIPPLISLLKDPNFPVQVTALQALGNSNDPRKLPPLLEHIESGAPQMRAIAAEALGKTGDSKYLQKILPLLKDPNFEARLAAIGALGRLNSPEALEPIVSLLVDSDPDVRKAAVESLARLRDARAVQALIPMLIDSESIVRHAAANALQVVDCHWQSSKEAEDLIPFLEASRKHESYSVRDAAAKTLRRIQNP